MAAPTLVAVGTAATGTGAVTPALPSGHTTDDVLLLIVQSSNQAITAPAGYTEIDTQTHMATGTAATALAVRLAVFWKRDNGSETAPTVPTTTNHLFAQILAYRGCITTGTPVSDNGTGIQSGSVSSVGFPNSLSSEWINGSSVTAATTNFVTTVNDSCVVYIVANAIDSNTTTFTFQGGALLTGFGGVTGASVASNTGTGGGFAVASGTLATAGPATDTSAPPQINASGTSPSAAMILALIPPVPIVPLPSLITEPITPARGHE